MARANGIAFFFPYGFPHPRGDGPHIGNSQPLGVRISPPTWGWPVCSSISQHAGEDFPTHVGMARLADGSEFAVPRFPHPRGDGPGLATNSIVKTPDFPTRVGMALAPD